MNWVIWTIRIAGAVFVGMYFVLPKLPRNRWGGMRVPYTLADDEVWQKVNSRLRWPLLFLGLLCLLFPLGSLQELMVLTGILVGLLMLMSIGGYFYARRLYVAKYGTTKVVRKGWFRYEPPRDADARQ